MKYDEFIGQVRTRAGLSSREDAQAATVATLTVLGQRLFGGEAKDLAAQLPPELASFLKGQPEERFDLDEFYERISEEEGVGIEDAVKHARAVCSVLSDAVSAGEIKDVLSQLPKGFADLFGSGGEREKPH